MAGDLALLLVVGVWAVIAVDDEAIQRQAGFVASGIRTVYDRLPAEQESFAVGRGGAAGSCKLVEQPRPGLR